MARAQLEVSECWAPWLAWVLEGWSGQQLAIAIDATTLGQRFVVLAISVVYRGCAVPVAWKILRATEKHPWQPEWLALLKHFRAVVPADWTVIVLADRGLYAKWLFQAIRALGWHPLLRVKSQGTFRPQGWYHWVPFTQLVPAVGWRWAGQGTAFQGKHTRLECTLLGCWDAGHPEAWLMLTEPRAARRGCLWVTDCAPGSSKASSASSAVAGNGNIPAWRIRRGRSGCGWLLPWRPGGCCRSAARPKQPCQPRRCLPCPALPGARERAGA
ncbi:hypothetical protein [Sulfuricaulis sp.]|uniref:hypothetical protein n=1 Tax=Sulfuricaulis sp. TaxID=2003553 RepID=UPI003C72FCC5